MNPLETLQDWIQEARMAGEIEPLAMALATSSGTGPSVRFVLMRGVTKDAIEFFTNLSSRKGQELVAHPRAAASFYWPSLQRQVRIEGPVVRLAESRVDEYFASRPRGHQIASVVSPQSRPIVSIEALRAEAADLERRLAGAPVPRPSGWGGFSMKAEQVELWTAGADRLHDRRLFSRSGEHWRVEQIGP